MKNIIYLLPVFILLVTSCKDDDQKVFDKSADERVAEAKANLKNDLIANPWKMKYTPDETSGSFWVLLNFNDDNTVTIKSDLGANDGEFFEQTLTYRIDSSLGLELIFETYSFFSFLFELDDATFPAEYEFNYVNKTPDNALVFLSKSDVGVPTRLLFEEANAGDENLIGIDVAENLNTMANDLNKLTSSLRIAYEDKDLALYTGLDGTRRVLSISAVSRKSNSANVEDVNFTTGYLIQGDSLILNTAFSGKFFGQDITLKGLKFNTLVNGSIDICDDPINVHSYEATTSTNDDVLVETTLLDLSGANFVETTTFYFAPLEYIFDNGEYVGDEIMENVQGALEMQLYYNYSGGLYGIGFYIENPDGSVTFALREFTPQLDGNRIIFDFEPTISIFNSPTQANVENINIYLNALTEGDNTYIFRLNDGVYELHNPCTGWSVVFVRGN
ncbi:MAG TPA: DUF4302 domain-containing protein [Ohtaekwangia sp.]|nr:DUF4302 domain-containing protein [Ohtaekwangia sp.]